VLLSYAGRERGGCNTSIFVQNYVPENAMNLWNLTR